MNIPAFLVYCAIMAVTPGPNNLMSLYLGASGLKACSWSPRRRASACAGWDARRKLQQ